jgi:hypothetical protein
MYTSVWVYVDHIDRAFEVCGVFHRAIIEIADLNPI